MMHRSARQTSAPAIRRQRRGFTLAEMMMVVFILGIIAAALVPPIGANLSSPRLRTAANVLAADIDFCSSECIAQPGAPRAVTFDLPHNKYSVIDFNTATALKHPGDGMDFINDFATGRSSQLTGVTIQSVVCAGAPVTTLTFDAYGRPLLAADMVITLRYNGVSMVLTVKYTTGDVSITGG